MEVALNYIATNRGKVVSLSVFSAFAGMIFCGIFFSSIVVLSGGIILFIFIPSGVYLYKNSSTFKGSKEKEEWQNAYDECVDVAIEFSELSNEIDKSVSELWDTDHVMRERRKKHGAFLKTLRKTKRQEKRKNREDRKLVGLRELHQDLKTHRKTFRTLLKEPVYTIEKQKEKTTKLKKINEIFRVSSTDFLDKIKAMISRWEASVECFDRMRKRESFVDEYDEISKYVSSKECNENLVAPHPLQELELVRDQNVNDNDRLEIANIDETLPSEIK